MIYIQFNIIQFNVTIVKAEHKIAEQKEVDGVALGISTRHKVDYIKVLFKGEGIKSSKKLYGNLGWPRKAISRKKQNRCLFWDCS